MNLVEHVKAELVRLDAEADAARRALAALQPNAGHVTAPATPVAKRAAKVAAGMKRAPDSELTKARKRVASAKRFGREPAAEDVRLVEVYAPSIGVSGAAAADAE